MAHKIITETKTRPKHAYKFYKKIIAIFGTGRWGIAIQFKHKEFFVGICINQLERQNFYITRKKIYKRGKITPVAYKL